jgi:hypothetical protein
MTVAARKMVWQLLARIAARGSKVEPLPAG